MLNMNQLQQLKDASHLIEGLVKDSSIYAKGEGKEKKTLHRVALNLRWLIAQQRIKQIKSK